LTLQIGITPESRARVHAAFVRLGSVTTGTAILNSLVAGALNIQNYAKQHAAYKTGTLRRSIHIGGFSHLAAGFNPSEGYGDIGGVISRPGYAQVSVGTNLVYARRIEYGFIGADKLGRVFNQRPRPYLRPAFDTQQDAVRQDIERALAILLKEAVRGGP